jgi:hypothetical protein
MLPPAAMMNVLAMPPPTISTSTFAASARRIVSLVETFDPATMATSGRAGEASARPSASSSAAISGPAHATAACFARPCVVASARCAVPKASLTYTSQSFAIFCASSSLSFFSPLFMRQFSSSTTLPGASALCHAPPATQSRTSGTGLPSNSDIRVAMGASESSAFHSPSVGRPRCDVTITAAPRSSASRMAGTDARMRVSSVMLPASSCGTLRSARMKTFLPRTSMSESRLNFIS